MSKPPETSVSRRVNIIAILCIIVGATCLLFAYLMPGLPFIGWAGLVLLVGGALVFIPELLMLFF